MNLGVYGIMSVFMNGFNLIIVYMIVPSLYYSIVFQCAPIIYLVCSMGVNLMIVPFYMVGVYVLGLMCIIVLVGVGSIWVVFSAISGYSKYSILGGFRIISQLVSFEFIFSCIYWYWIYGYYGCGMMGW